MWKAILVCIGKKDFYEKMTIDKREDVERCNQDLYGELFMWMKEPG